MIFLSQSQVKKMMSCMQLCMSTCPSPNTHLLRILHSPKLPIHTHEFIHDMKVIPKPHLQSMTMDNPAEIRATQRLASPYYQWKSETIRQKSKLSHFNIKLKCVLMVPMRDIGSDNGVPQKKMVE